MGDVGIGVLGPVVAHADGVALTPPRPRVREVLALLVAAGGRTVSTDALVDDLWDGAPPAGAVGAVRTFVGELRRALEPDRAPRTAPRVVVTRGAGYALDLPPDAVDAWRVTRLAADARTAPPDAASRLLADALGAWRGEAYEELADRPWVQPERARLAALRADVTERLADALLATDRAADVVTLLDPHVGAHPWREDGWRLLATALHRTGRPADALDVLRRARRTFAEDLGLDPGPALRALEQQVLERRDDDAARRTGAGPDVSAADRAARDPAARDETWHDGTWHDGSLSALDRRGGRARLEASGAVLTSLAVSGDLATVRAQRLASIAAAERLGDPLLTARVVGGLEAPGVWTRPDDEELARAVVAAATRTLPRVTGTPATRGRLLATIAIEERGTAAREPEAREAEQIARDLGDRHLLCLALSGRAMQRFGRTGLAADRERIGAHLVTTASCAESTTFRIAGRIVRMQALCALGRLDDAAAEADDVDALASAAERPLASVFTAWFRHTFAGAPEPAAPDEMPGFSRGIVALGRVTRAVREGEALPEPGDLGPYEPWVRPLLLVRNGHRDQARRALRSAPPPPHDLLQEVAWALLLTAAREADARDVVARAVAALEPARSERAAGSGVVDLGAVDALLGD